MRLRNSRGAPPPAPAVAGFAGARDIAGTMLRRFLLALLVLLLGFAIVAKARARWHPAAPARSGTTDPTRSPAARRRNGSLLLPSGPAPLLEPSTRASARVRLAAEPDRQYLDSLFIETDSIVRHWPVGGAIIGYAIVPGGAPGFEPEMVTEVRSALDTWSPASVGLRFRENLDTAGATLVVRWCDTLDANRAGLTDVTWDRAGRIRRADVYLATRSPSTGRPLAVEVRQAVALHELGHALGLPHSSRTGDVMFPFAAETTLSDRDRFSLRLLYELPAGWIGTGGPASAP